MFGDVFVCVSVYCMLQGHIRSGRWWCSGDKGKYVCAVSSAKGIEWRLLLLVGSEVRVG